MKRKHKKKKSARANTVFYLELHSDLKRLVGVLQGLKAHVRVTVESGEVDLYHWIFDDG